MIPKSMDRLSVCKVEHVCKSAQDQGLNIAHLTILWYGLKFITPYSVISKGILTDYSISFRLGSYATLITMVSVKGVLTEVGEID